MIISCCLIDFDNAKIQLYFHFCKFLAPKQPHFKALFYTPFLRSRVSDFSPTRDRLNLFI